MDENEKSVNGQGNVMKSRFFSTCLAVTLGVASFTVHSDIYRCTQSDGKSAYQEMPCSTGTQKSLDDSDQKRREKIATAREASTDVKRKQEANMQAGWAACQVKKNCTDFCYIPGESLAIAYLANIRQMTESGLMASRMMREGCEEAVGKFGADCALQCERGFKLKVK
jgi:hypothetical protein